MIIKAKNVQRRIMPEEQQGTGHVIGDFLVEAEDCPRHCRMFSIITLEKGCSIGKHFHVAETELYYCLSGEGIICDHGDTQPFVPGDVDCCGSGSYHTIKNEKEEPLVFLVSILLHHAKK